MAFDLICEPHDSDAITVLGGRLRYHGVPNGVAPFKLTSEYGNRANGGPARI